jgi:hypothetical protein
MKKIENVSFNITDNEIHVTTDNTTYIYETQQTSHSIADFTRILEQIKNLSKDLPNVKIKGYKNIETTINNLWHNYCSALLNHDKGFNKMKNLALQLQQTGIFEGYWNNPLLENEIYPLAEIMKKLRQQIHQISTIYKRLQQVKGNLYHLEPTDKATFYL